MNYRMIGNMLGKVLWVEAAFLLPALLISLVRGLTVMRLKNHVRVTAESALWIKMLSLPANFFRKYQIGDLALRMQGVALLSHQLSSTVANGTGATIYNSGLGLEGAIEMLLSLVRKGLISEERAAEEAHMSVSQFREQAKLA